MEGDRLSAKMQDTAIWTLKNKTSFQIVSKDMESPDSRVQKDKLTNQWQLLGTELLQSRADPSENCGTA